MIVDSSAVISVILSEEDAQLFSDVMGSADELLMSTANYVEAAIKIDAMKDDFQVRKFRDLLSEMGVSLVPVTPTHAEIARDAYRRFGKGNHPARLNFGDTFAYALAKERDMPLLFKGKDFSQTDVKAALPAAGSDS